MSYVIETDGIRVEAETERKAKAALRKALAQRDAEILADCERREAARTNCRANGYYLLTRYLDGQEIEVNHDAKIHRVEKLDNGNWRLSVFTNNGDGVIEFWDAPRIDAWAMNCAGWPLAMLANLGDGKTAWYVIGAAGGVLVYDELPKAFDPAGSVAAVA